MNVRGKRWYNPGLASVVLLHVPIGIYYIHTITVQGLSTPSDYVYRLLAFAAATAMLVVLPVQLLKNRNSPCPFTHEDMTRFDMVEKLKQRGLLQRGSARLPCKGQRRMAKRQSRTIGRPLGTDSTRGDILAAARKAFGATGYDGASVRAIAASAGVDPSTVIHFFGTKDGLFQAVVKGIADATGPLLADLERGASGKDIVKAYLHIWEDDASAAAMRAAIRTAMGSERAMQLFQKTMLRRVLAAIANRDTFYAELLTTHLIGLGIGRYIARMPELSKVSIDTIAERVGPLLDRTVSVEKRKRSG